MQIVCSLPFLSTRSCLDLSFPVNYLTLFMTSATEHHLQIAYRILKYLKNTKNLKLEFHSNLGLDFHIMVDSSYASHLDRKSQYGISTYMNSKSGSCITLSKNSKFIALSYTEAEYIALFEAKIIIWLRQFLIGLGYLPSQPTPLFEDNKSAIHIVNNGNDKNTWISAIIMFVNWFTPIKFKSSIVQLPR